MELKFVCRRSKKKVVSFDLFVILLCPILKNNKGAVTPERLLLPLPWCYRTLTF